MQQLKNIYHLFQAILANLWYGFPSRKLNVIGVTGTDGKTTTTHLIAHILKTAEKKVSFISSVYASIAGKEYDTGFHVTTPDAFSIQKYLKMAVDNHQEYFILETTSHRLEQNQLFGTKFEIGVITNITHEHLDYHGTYEEYVKAKLKLLLNSKVAVVNKDDASFNILKDQISKIKYQSYSAKFKVLEELPNLTKFNQYNYAAAYTVCKQLGLSDEMILKAMKSFQLPKGRFDLVYDKDFKVIIDFAHTPNALLQLLPEIRKKYLKKNGRLIHVFGSAGLRDFTKRPLMGEASNQFSDQIILTEYDYRSEDLRKICQQIASGIKNKNYQIILDRQQAINQVIKIAKANDVVVITGKAHEKSLCRGKTEYQWDEYEAVEKALKI
ncbi:MAG: Mur ligase family protein [Candidatus Roizmanbacteria bacterium]|nr:Mur ligase family protein [Candidatus Roizmanbacteria bacterium]